MLISIFLFISSITNANKSNNELITSISSNIYKIILTQDSLYHDSIVNMHVDSGLNIYILRAELLSEINAERLKVGLELLKINDTLNNVAQNYAQYMSENDWYSHADKKGHKTIDRLHNAGYKKLFGGENIHNGPRTIHYVMKDWMESRPHSKNILNEFSIEIGIGYCNGYWVLDFGLWYPWLQ